MHVCQTHVCQRGIAEVKISITHSWHTPVFSLRVFNSSVVGQGKCGIDNWQGGPLAKASQRWLQLVGMFTNQNQINILIYKLIHIFHAYFIHIEGNTVPAPGGSLPSINNVLIMPTQNRLPNALVEKVEGGLKNFKVRKTNQAFNYFLF